MLPENPKGKRRGKILFERIGRRLGGILFLILQKGIRLFPISVIRFLGRLGGDILFALLKRKRSLTIQNLQHVLNLPEAQPLARQNFRNLALVLPEMFKLYNSPPEEIRRNIQVNGLEHLEEAKRRGKGTICISAHQGNFLIIPIRLSLEGYFFTLLVRPERNPLVEEIFLRLRRQAEITTLYRGQTYRSLVKALKGNNILWLFLDQFPRRGDLTLPFLNVPFPIYTGHARLAHLTGATVLPITISWVKYERTHHIEILPPIQADDNSKEEHDLIDALRQPLHLIEECIRLHPDEWLWWHKDWFRSKKLL